MSPDEHLLSVSILVAQRRGFATYSEINDAIEQEGAESEEIEQLMIQLDTLGIFVVDEDELAIPPRNKGESPVAVAAILEALRTFTVGDCRKIQFALEAVIQKKIAYIERRVAANIVKPVNGPEE